MSNKVLIKITESEAILLKKILDVQDAFAMLDVCKGDKNLAMIFERILCDIEKAYISTEYNSYEEMIDICYRDIIDEFGEYNDSFESILE